MGDVLVFKSDSAYVSGGQRKRKSTNATTQQRFWVGRYIQELVESEEVGESKMAIHWFDAKKEFGKYQLMFKPKSEKPYGKKFVSEESQNSVLYSFTFDAAAESLNIPDKHAAAIRKVIESGQE